MIKLENTEVLGWEAAIRGMRNPMNSWEKSDSWFDFYEYYANAADQDAGILTSVASNILGENSEKWCPLGEFPYEVAEDLGDKGCIGPNDAKLMMNLAKAGSVDAKYRRMIMVAVDITAPLYWWKEFDTYKIGTVANSCSTMHKIHSKEFTLDDFSHEHLFSLSIDEEMPDFVTEANKAYEEWNALGEDKWTTEPPNSAEDREIDWHYEHGAFEAGPEWNDYKNWVGAEYALDCLEHTIHALNQYREYFLETKDKRYWWQMIQLLPSSYNQRRTVMLNYEVLAGIYPKRKDHKLDEWHDFCDWIKSLPYSEIITLEEA